jgi:hypothetical protein
MPKSLEASSIHDFWTKFYIGLYFTIISLRAIKIEDEPAVKQYVQLKYLSLG